MPCPHQKNSPPPRDSSGTNVLVKLLPIESAIWPCTVAIVEGHPNSEVHLDVNQGLGCFHVHLQVDAGENGEKKQRTSHVLTNCFSSPSFTLDVK